MIVPCMLIV